MKNCLRVYVSAAELAVLCQNGRVGAVTVLFDDQGFVVSIKLKNTDSRLRKNSVWHETRYDELRALINEGLTYQQIGDLFGVSKNMVQYRVDKLLPEWREKQGLV